jgi:hypothetical protein
MYELIPWRRMAATLLLIVPATGCTSWKNQGTDAAAVITPSPSPSPAPSNGTGESPFTGFPGLGTAQQVYSPTADTARRIRITTQSQGVIELRNPRVANDSLYGQDEKNSPERAFALADVTGIETHGVSAVKTTLLVVGVLALTLTAATGVFVATCSDAVFGC